MKRKEHQQLKALDTKDLKKDLRTAKQHFLNITFEKNQGALKDTSELKKTRKYIAQIETELSSRRNEQDPLASTT